MNDDLRNQIDKSVNGYLAEYGTIPGERFSTGMRGAYCANDSLSVPTDDAVLIAFSDHRLLIHRAGFLAGWWSGPRALIPLANLLSVEPVEDSNRLFDFILIHEKHERVRVQLPKEGIPEFFQSLVQARANHINPVSKEKLTECLGSLHHWQLCRVLEQAEAAAAVEQFSPIPHLYCGQVAAAIGENAKSVEHLLAALPALTRLPFQILCSLPFDAAACLYISESFPAYKAPESLFLRLLCEIRLRRYSEVRAVAREIRGRFAGQSHLEGISEALAVLPAEERELIKWPDDGNDVECEWQSQAIPTPQISESLSYGGDFARLAMDVMIRVDPIMRGCAVWTKLRCNDRENAQQICETATPLNQKLLSSVAFHRQRSMWTASMALMEVNARLRRFDDLGDIALSAYSHIATRDWPDGDATLAPELVNATEVRQFYAALGDQASRLASLYSNRLHDVNVEWSKAVLDAAGLGLRFAEDDSDWREILDMFDRWTRTALLRADRQAVTDQIKHALRTFDEVFRSSRIRVIVLGETSAGKSALLNRLLGVEVLPSGRSETTTVPTHLRSVSRDVHLVRVYGRNGDVMDENEFAAGDADLNRIQELIHSCVALESAGREHVIRVDVEIAARDASIGEDLEIVDAPGLNAHDERTNIVLDAVSRAHACVFVIDGRSALKAGEFRSLEWTREAMSRTLFVVNKCDLLEDDDDELDVGPSQLPAVLDRVRSVLREVSGTDDTVIVATSAATGKGIDELRAQLKSLLDETGEEAVLYAASRAARTVADQAIDHVLARSESSEVVLRSLMASMPTEPAVFEVTLKAQVRNAWSDARERYIERMSSAVQRSLSDFNRRVEQKISTYAPRGLDGLAAFARRELRPLLDDLVQRVGKVRDEEWIALGQRTTAEAVDYFQTIYEEINFGQGFDPESMLESATPMPLQRRMESTLKSIDDKVSGLATSAAMGVGIGVGVGQMLGGGWGALIGGAIGALGAHEQFEKAKAEVCGLIDSQIQRCITELTEALQADLDGKPGQPTAPMLGAILDAIDEQRSACESAVVERIDAVKEKISATGRELSDVREMAGAAAEWSQRFELFGERVRKRSRGS